MRACGRVAVVLAGCALACVAVVLAAPVARAHAVLVASTPADGAVLPAAPSVVSLTFDEAVQLVPGAVTVIGPDGRRVDDGRPRQPRGQTVAVGLRGATRRGTYLVNWRVISADSHPVNGAISFSVGAPSPPPVVRSPEASTAVGVAFGAARFLAYAGFTGLVGAVAFCCYGGPVGARTPAVRRLIVAAWAVLVTGTLGALVLMGPYTTGGGFGDLSRSVLLGTTLHTRAGSMLAARMLLLGATPTLLAWGLGGLERAARRQRLAFGACGGVVAVAMAATWAWSGHAGSGPQAAGALPADLAHLLAVALWGGGLAAVLATLADPDGSSTAAVTAVRRFSRVAAWCVAVLVATGLYQAWLRVGTPGTLLATGYGRLLLAKVAVFAGVLAAAAGSRARLRRTMTPGDAGGEGRRMLRRLVTVEAAGAVVVLALTAVLVESQPAVTAYAALPATRTARFDTGGPNGRGSVVVRLPDTARGLDTADLAVTGTDGHPRDVPEVDAAWSLPERGVGPLQARVSRTGPGRYRLSWAPLTLTGGWQLAVTVRTSAIDETTVRIPVRIR